MSEDNTIRDSHPTNGDGEGIDLLDFFIVLAKHKRLVLGFPLAIAVIAAITSFLMDNIYVGVAKILPPQQNQSSASALLGQLTGQLGALGALGGVAGSSLGIKNPNDLYIGMLKSRVVADSMIKRFDLQKLYKQDYLVDTRRVLDGKSKFTSGKDSIIEIEVSDKNPKRAAELANGYVDELNKLTQTLAVTEAGQRRLFFERQLDIARRNLSVAEAGARSGLDKGGLVVVDAQGKAMAETTARLRGQISVKEIQISAMRSFATDRHPELLQAQYELDAMKKELARIEGTANGAEAQNAQGKEGMESFNLLRELKYREAIVDLLVKQFEMAKIEEARDTSIIQVLEPAVTPEKKSRPKRAIITIASALVAGLIAVLWAFGREAAEKARQDPERVERLTLLRRYLWAR